MSTNTNNYPENRTWRRVNTRIAVDAYQLMRCEVHRQAEIEFRNVTNGEVVTQALRAFLGSGSRSSPAPPAQELPVISNHQIEPTNQ